MATLLVTRLVERKKYPFTQVSDFLERGVDNIACHSRKPSNSTELTDVE